MAEPVPTTGRLRKLEAEWRRLYRLAESLANLPMRIRDYKRMANAIHDCKAAKAAYEAESAIVGPPEGA